MNYFIRATLFSFLTLFFFMQERTIGQKNTGESSMDSLYVSKNFEALKFRNIGPAMMSGRVADIAIDPMDESTWYVAMGSSGIWKTSNAGITWAPIFDDQGSFSIGCLTINPQNHHQIWAGTGENVGGRHTSIGDGLYKSEDGGAHWKKMGLEASEHISKIIIHPMDASKIWVAVQGPLWSSGGERGLYKSDDGGLSWTKKLGDDEWTGVTDLMIDPRNPNRLYAATWQRHRTVAAYMGGGPKTAIYKSEDGGESWNKLTNGLPSETMGKIGLALSPQKPDVIYAAIELNRRKGGVYKSTDRGESWVKQSDAVSGATGPHYYQELWASPHQFDRLYLADNRMQVSDDGGKTFRRMKNVHKHVDNHAVAFKKNDPEYLLVGCDGGVYETFDGEENWRFMANLPTLQFYKVAVDDAFPFYNIYGGTQDNNSLGGPSRTDNIHGITNADWFMTLFADGHQSATEPGNPDIMYAEWQEGNLVRVDRTTGEIVYIQPQPAENDAHERFNWDAPILISPHQPTRLYFASQRVWKSEDRGDSWTPISIDLTRDEDPITLPIMGKTQSWDAPWDIYAMSNYNTITSLAESPVQEGLIYAGTDDGIIQISENGGENWRKIEVSQLPNCPKTAFVNDIKADLFDANTVYVALDNHKYGDYNPYLFVSRNRGKTWQSMTGDLPKRRMVWRLVQDHVDSKLFFLGTEFGLYFSPDAGKRWIQLKGGLPTISFRDLAIQKRENDLVCASFGRGFFVLDDYSALRSVNSDLADNPATLFTPRDAWWYMPKKVLGGSPKGIQGASYYAAPNPDFGATFTYFINNEIKTKYELRTDAENELIKNNESIPFPGWDSLEVETHELEPMVWLFIRDSQGSILRKIKANRTKGMHRLSWNLRFPPTNAIQLGNIDAEINSENSGYLAAPGTYSAELVLQQNGKTEILSPAVSFEVKPLYAGYLKGDTPQEVAAFWRTLEDFQRDLSATRISLNQANKRMKAIELAMVRSGDDFSELYSKWYVLREQLLALDRELNGYTTRNSIGANNPVTLNDRIGAVQIGVFASTYGPTPTHLKSFEIAQQSHHKLKDQLVQILENELPLLEQQLSDLNAPWIEGQPIPKK